MLKVFGLRLTEPPLVQVCQRPRANIAGKTLHELSVRFRPERLTEVLADGAGKVGGNCRVIETIKDDRMTRIGENHRGRLPVLWREFEHPDFFVERPFGVGLHPVPA